MRSPQTDEARMLQYLGGSFDPQADYTAQTTRLIADLIRDYGQDGAIRRTEGVMSLVLAQINDPKLRPAFYDTNQQMSFYVWLKTLKAALGPKIVAKTSKPKAKKRLTKHHSKKPKLKTVGYGRKNRIGVMAHERQLWQAAEHQAQNGLAPITRH